MNLHGHEHGGGSKQIVLSKAIFFDKDGTLIVNVPFNVEPSLIRLMPRSKAGLRAFAAAGFELIIVSNQPGVALGYFAEAHLLEVEITIREKFKEIGVVLAASYFCPHAPAEAQYGSTGSCRCRKPAAGMIERAARERSIDLEGSWLIGDILDDIQAGRSAGCRTVLIDNGNETEWNLSSLRRPDWVVANINEAARIILDETSC